MIPCPASIDKHKCQGQKRRGLDILLTGGPGLPGGPMKPGTPG
jgi:hypothetical protein